MRLLARFAAVDDIAPAAAGGELERAAAILAGRVRLLAAAVRAADVLVDVDLAVEAHRSRLSPHLLHGLGDLRVRRARLHLQLPDEPIRLLVLFVANVLRLKLRVERVQSLERLRVLRLDCFAALVASLARKFCIFASWYFAFSTY